METNKLNFAFWGTPALSSNTLEILLQAGYKPSIVITSPDNRSGRGMHINQTPVSAWAEKNNIKCLKPEKINQEFIDEFSKLNIDLSIVVAYGKILPERIITLPKLGTINIHYSLLPKYRGASPLEQALLNGDEATGVSIQQMAYKLDSGPIIEEIEVKIDVNENKEQLRNKLTKIGADTLCRILPQIINSEVTLKIQDESSATYCTKIKKEDGKIDINGDTKENYNKYRAFYGWPGTYFFVNKKGKDIRVKIVSAKLENDSFLIEKVVPEGKKEIKYEEFFKSITLK